MKKLILILFSFFLINHAIAKEYEQSKEESNVLGATFFYKMKKDETLRDVAEIHKVSILHLMSANPLADPITSRGLVLEIPHKLIIPNVEKKGIVVNLAELRLYYFPETEDKVYVFPVGVGRIGWATPVMTTNISQMIRNPTWTPTKRIRAAHFKKHGKHLPDVVPAGSDNPLGHYAMRLKYGDGSYLIHGTNKTVGLGMRVSSGCIRMNPPDIEFLFSKANHGMPVKIINQPFKYTKEKDGKIYVEVHQPLSETWDERKTYKVITPPNDFIVDVLDNKEAYYSLGFALQNQTGIPLRIK